MKKVKILICVLVLIIIGLGVLVVLFATGKLNCKKCCEDKTTSEVKLDISKLENIGKGDYNILKSVSTQYAPYSLLSNGKVIIGFDRELSNINNAIDIVFDTKDNLYILTKDGNLYKYYTGVTKEATLEATKLDDYKDIKMITEYHTRGKASGGCDFIIAIDKDNNYKTLDAFCV